MNKKFGNNTYLRKERMEDGIIQEIDANRLASCDKEASSSVAFFPPVLFAERLRASIREMLEYKGRAVFN